MLAQAFVRQGTGELRSSVFSLVVSLQQATLEAPISQPPTTHVLPQILCYGAVEVTNRVEVPHMPAPGRNSDVTAEYYRPGGQALNVALALAAWGLHPAVMGNQLGEDAYGDLIRRELERHPSVQATWLQPSDHARTPYTRIFVLPDRERYEVRYWHDQRRWTPLVPDMLAGVRLVSTDVEAGEAGNKAAQIAHLMGIKVVTTDVVAPDHTLTPLSDLIVTSVTYLRRSAPGFSSEGVPDLAERLLAGGAGRVIVTNGVEPVQVYDRQSGRCDFASFPLPPVDRTGGGDVFKAACLLGLAQDWDIEKYVRFGAAAAALWITQPSPLKRPPSLAEIEALLAERGPRTVVAAPALDANERVCPLCKRVLAAALFDKHWGMEPLVVETVRRAYPGWRRTEGACPQCVHEQYFAALQAQPTEAPLVLEGHPIYGRPDLFVLPTPVRLRANLHYTGRGITICFLDSGFYPHPDLMQPENRIVTMVDATTDEVAEGVAFREPRGVSWHGMMTSVAAAGNGALSHGRYAGIASDAHVVLVKITDARGRIHERDILRGLRWVLQNHERYDIRIVNLSVGGDRSGLGRQSGIDSLVQQLVQRGVLLVAAAGNAGRSDLYPPASAPEAITVGGIDDQNVLDPEQRRMYASNWGRMANGVLKPEVVAPSMWLAAPVLPGTRIAEQNLLLGRLWQAEDSELPALIVSTYQVLGFARSLFDEPPARQRQAVRDKMIENKFVTPYYQHVDGTSFAAPIVSSVAAQMMEANPRLSPDWVKNLLVATATRLPNEPEERQGNGMITPGRAVAAALRERFGALDEAPLSPYANYDGIHFVFYDRRARHVAVVGDFNDWNPATLPMQSDRPWQWRALLRGALPGRYRYKFLVDGERWLDDPENGDKEADGYGGFSAVLQVG